MLLPITGTEKLLYTIDMSQSINEFQKHIVDNSDGNLKDLKVLGQDDDKMAIGDVLK